MPLSSIDVGARRQLFLDDGWLVESMQGVRAVMNQPVKFGGNPILRPDQPWEDVQFGLHGYLGAAYDDAERLFKMWHGVFAPTSATAYVTSKDGLNWEKPRLGIVEHEGSRQNNLVFNRSVVEASGLTWQGGLLVFVDRGDADPAKRYKAGFKAARGAQAGRGAAYSADGLHWNVWPQLIEFDSESAVSRAETNIFWDDRIGRYVRFNRMNTAEGKRAVGRSESRELLRGWDRSTMVLAPDEVDPPAVDFYSSGGFKYAEADNVYLMTMPVWDHWRAQVWLRLASSRDGKTWRWAGSREPFLPLGPPGSWDSQRIHPGLPAVTVGDTTFFYYVGHNVPTDLFGHKTGQIGVATLQRDRFISLMAGRSGDELPPWEDYSGGTVTTRPLRFKGSTLTVNAAVAGPWPDNPASATPELRVEILDRDGKPVQGFDYDACRPVTGDSTAHAIVWKADLRLFESTTIRLRFRMRFTHLYGFQFMD